MWEEILRKWGSRSGKTRRWITDLDWSKPEIPDNNGELVVNRIKFRMCCLFLRRRWKRRNVAGSYEFASASQYQKIRIIRLCRWNNITVSRCSILVSASVPQSGTKSGFAYNWSCNGAAEVISGLTRLPKDFPPPPPPILLRSHILPTNTRGRSMLSTHWTKTSSCSSGTDSRHASIARPSRDLQRM